MPPSSNIRKSAKNKSLYPEVPAVQALIVFYSVRGVVAVRVLLLPVPAVGAHFLDAVLSHPAKLIPGLGGVSIALGDVAGAAGLDDVGDGLAAGLLEGVDDIQHAVALAGAEVAVKRPQFVSSFLMAQTWPRARSTTWM